MGLRKLILRWSVVETIKLVDLYSLSWNHQMHDSIIAIVNQENVYQNSSRQRCIDTNIAQVYQPHKYINNIALSTCHVSGINSASHSQLTWELILWEIKRCLVTWLHIMWNTSVRSYIIIVKNRQCIVEYDTRM